MIRSGNRRVYWYWMLLLMVYGNDVVMYVCYRILM